MTYYQVYFFFFLEHACIDSQVCEFLRLDKVFTEFLMYVFFVDAYINIAILKLHCP